MLPLLFIWPFTLFVVAQLPLPVADPGVGQAAWALIILAVVLVNAGLNGLKLYLDRKDRQNGTHACNMPVDVVATLRAAMSRQQSIAEAAEKADERHERNIDRLATALERHTDRLSELLAESRAFRRSRSDE